jgi:hypothetical protein
VAAEPRCHRCIIYSHIKPVLWIPIFRIRGHRIDPTNRIDDVIPLVSDSGESPALSAQKHFPSG